MVHLAVIYWFLFGAVIFGVLRSPAACANSHVLRRHTGYMLCGLSAGIFVFSAAVAEAVTGPILQLEASGQQRLYDGVLVIYGVVRIYAVLVFLLTLALGWILIFWEQMSPVRTELMIRIRYRKIHPRVVKYLLRVNEVMPASNELLGRGYGRFRSNEKAPDSPL